MTAIAPQAFARRSDSVRLGAVQQRVEVAGRERVAGADDVHRGHRDAGVLGQLAVATGDGAARTELDDGLDAEALGERGGLGRAAQQHRLVLARDDEIAALGQLAQHRRGLLLAPQAAARRLTSSDTRTPPARANWSALCTAARQLGESAGVMPVRCSQRAPAITSPAALTSAGSSREAAEPRRR